MHSPLFFIREDVKSVCDYENNNSYEDELDDDENETEKHLNDEDDGNDDIIFFFDPEYGYTEDEEDCNEDNDLYNEN